MGEHKKKKNIYLKSNEDFSSMSLTPNEWRPILIDLLGFGECNTPFEVEEQFKDLANFLIPNFIFNINYTKFRISCIELGINKVGVMNDEIHCRDIQTHCGYLYVHKSGNGEKAFRAGKIKGFDITCGENLDEETRYFGTILVKGIVVSDEDEYPGPSLALGRLVRGSGGARNFEAWSLLEKTVLESLDGISILQDGVLEYSSTAEKPILSFSERDSIRSDRELLSKLKLKAQAPSKMEIKGVRNQAQRNLYLHTDQNNSPEQEKPFIPVLEKRHIEPSNNGSLLQIHKLPAKQMLNEFLAKPELDLSINGNLINAESINFLRTSVDLKSLKGKSGCYFIFSSLKKDRVFAFSSDGHLGFNHPIIKDQLEMFMIYSGKSDDIGGRLKIHLFSTHTKMKVKNCINEGKRKRLGGTGAMSLEYLNKDEVSFFESNGAFDQKEMRLKPFLKALNHPDNNLIRSKIEGEYFLNGIDITEPQWNGESFGVVVLETDHPVAPGLIEEAFVAYNFRPPLCRRFG